MATTKKGTTTKAAKAAKVAAPAKSRRVFPVGQCHHRDAEGNPDCTAKIVAKRANLCPPHEKVWQKAARARYAANRAVAQTPATTKPRTRKPTAQQDADAVIASETAGTTPTATAPEDLEAALAASNAAFATPELAAKARAKRAARGR